MMSEKTKNARFKSPSPVACVRSHEYARQRVKYLIEQGGLIEEGHVALKEPGHRVVMRRASGFFGASALLAVCFYADIPNVNFPVIAQAVANSDPKLSVPEQEPPW